MGYYPRAVTKALEDYLLEVGVLNRDTLAREPVTAYFDPPKKVKYPEQPLKKSEVFELGNFTDPRLRVNLYRNGGKQFWGAYLPRLEVMAYFDEVIPGWPSLLGTTKTRPQQPTLKELLARDTRSGETAK